MLLDWQSKKDWKDEIINLAKTVLQIIKYFKFIENSKKNKSVFQISISKLLLTISKKLCKNPKYIKKGLINQYINCC